MSYRVIKRPTLVIDDDMTIVGIVLDKEVIPFGGGEGGTTDYNSLINKPSINGKNLKGALSSKDLQIIDEDGVNVLIDNKTKDLATTKYVDDSIKDVELAKFPNVTIIGSPVINGGQMRGFSANDYARFPFLVDLTNKPFEINFDILTGSNVATQENIFDSDFGFAFAIRNSRFIIAMSSTGTSWDIGEATGANVVLPNVQYKVRISWDTATYKVELSTNGGKSYVTDIAKDSTASLYPTQIYIGVGEDHAQVLNSFSGMIDFTKANLVVDGNITWVGLDVVGLETRLAKDVSNIDAAGEEKIRQIAGGGTIELTEEHLTGETYNGKPVYEITIDTGALGNKSFKTTPHNIANIDIFMGFEGVANQNSGMTCNMSTPHDTSPNMYQLLLNVDKTNIYIYYRSGDFSQWVQSRVTMRYTKITD